MERTSPSEVSNPSGWVGVVVPEGVKAGDPVSFPSDGKSWIARVPEEKAPGDVFGAKVENDRVLQAQELIVPNNAKPGDSLPVPGFDGQSRYVRVPQGTKPGQTVRAMVPVPQGLPQVPVGDPLEDDELEPWLHAARKFTMNSDFEVPDVELVERFDLQGLIAAMKAGSENRLTIQALGDKIVLNQMLDNLGVPQMPMLLAIQDPTVVKEEVEAFVDQHLIKEDARDVILKPTHLSNGDGLIALKAVAPTQREATIEHLKTQVTKFLSKQASAHESQALQSVRPGYIAQPRYQSVIGFSMPLELRVVALWGKVRMGVWWWGDQAPQRNLWIVRQHGKEFSDDDNWEAAHEHTGSNPGFDAAVRLFTRHMPRMAATTEHIAVSCGAPFLRADFFVGSSEFGVRLNEVAYGSGIEYRRRGEKGLVNDSIVVAQILQEGMAECTMSMPAERFLARLGAQGQTYDEVTVNPVPPECRIPSRSLALNDKNDTCSAEWVMPKEMCLTPRPGGSSCVPSGGQDPPSPPPPVLRVSPPPAPLGCQQGQRSPGSMPMWVNDMTMVPVCLGFPRQKSAPHLNGIPVARRNAKVSRRPVRRLVLRRPHYPTPNGGMLRM